MLIYFIVALCIAYPIGWVVIFRMYGRTKVYHKNKHYFRKG